MNEMKPFDVVVVGCGMMGSSLARTLAADGHRVAAWNRSPEKASKLADAGVTPVTDLSDAVAQSRIVLACTATYETTRSAIGQADRWDGVTLVNVGSGAFDEVEAMQEWAIGRGADYLDGAILCYPEHLGTSAGVVLFSGPEKAWAANEPILSSLGRATYVSARVRGASILDTAMTGAFFISSLAAYTEAATYALSEGLTADDLTLVTATFVELIGVKAGETARAIENGRHETDQATISVFSAGARLCVDAMQNAGHRARMIEAAAQSLLSAEENGLGDLGFSAQAQTATLTPW